MRQLMFEIVLRKRRFRNTCHPQNHREQCFLCSWQKNEIILWVSVLCHSTPRCTHIYWLGCFILIMPFQNHKDIIFTTHACHHLKAYAVMLGIMYKMVIAIKLSLFPLLSNKRCKKYFQKAVYQSALLSQW